jgi:hypothetical protein
MRTETREYSELLRRDALPEPVFVSDGVPHYSLRVLVRLSDDQLAALEILDREYQEQYRLSCSIIPILSFDDDPSFYKYGL